MRSVSGDGFTLEHYRSAFSNPKNFEEICNNLFVSSAATVLSTLIGRAVAWLVSRTDLGMRKIIHLLMLTHFFIPPFISAMACQQLLGPVGLINKWYMQISGSTDPLIHIYGQSGVLFVFTLSGSVLMYMVVINSFQKVQASLEEAAIITGAGALRTLRDITLPVPGPSVLSAMILVFMSNISNYGAPSALGYHVSYHTLTTRIYEVLQDFSLQNQYGGRRCTFHAFGRGGDAFSGRQGVPAYRKRLCGGYREGGTAYSHPPWNIAPSHYNAHLHLRVDAFGSTVPFDSGDLADQSLWSSL